MPANSGLLKMPARSLVSKVAQSQGEIVDSLWRIFEIFPFLRDAVRRPGAISTAGGGTQSRSMFSKGRSRGCCRVPLSAPHHHWANPRRRFAWSVHLAGSGMCSLPWAEFIESHRANVGSVPDTGTGGLTCFRLYDVRPS